MTSLPRLLTTARRFVDGVCAIPNVSSIATREVHRLERDSVASRQWLDAVDENRRLARQLENASTGLEAACANRDEFRRGEESALDKLHETEQHLAAEREAHEETRRHWQDEHENGVGLTKEIYALGAQLSAALTEFENERNEHAKALDAITEESQSAMRLFQETRELKSELSAARADLEALTKLANDIESVWGSWHCDPSHVDNWVDGLDRIRAAFAALAAWKAREGGTDV